MWICAQGKPGRIFYAENFKFMLKKAGKEVNTPYDR